MDNKTLVIYMQRDYRRDWQQCPVGRIPSKEKLPGFLFGLLEKEMAKTVLDLGCGIGKFAIGLYNRGYSVVGVDINKEAVKSAKAESQKAINPASGNYLKFYAADAIALELKEAPFDAVLMQLLISIIGGPAERRELLHAARALLKQGGLLYLSASGVSGGINPKYAETYEKDFPLTGEKHTYFSRDADGKVLYATHHFTGKELRELLSAEFKEIKIRKAREASSRRPEEAAYFLYATAKAK